MNYVNHNFFIIFFKTFFFTYKKMSKNLSAKYYQENKEIKIGYPNRSKEGKEKKQQYGCERYKNISDDEKQKLAEYRKKLLQNEKKRFIIIIKKYFDLENFASL